MKRIRLFFLTGSVLSLFAAPAHAASYIVAPGDTLTKIAKMHGSTVQQLMAENHLTSDRIWAGQTLAIPSAGTMRSIQPALTQKNVPSTPRQPASNAGTAQPGKQLAAPAMAAGTLLPANGAGSGMLRATVAVPVLNVRTGPSLTSPIIAKLTQGTTVSVTEPGDEWTRVRLAGQDVYLATRYLSFLPVVTPETNSSDPLPDKLNAIIQPLLGTPYVLGGTTPQGFDCSGFTWYVFQQLGITLPRTSAEQFQVGTEVSREEMKPGDLLFYDTFGTGKVTHVAIYVGDGRMVHANGDNVRFEEVADMDKLYPCLGIKRILPADAE